MSINYKKILTKGYQSALSNTPVEDGKIRVTIDTGQLFIDHDETRTEVTDIVKGHTEEEILATIAPLPKIYLSSDTHKLLVFDGENWLICGEQNPESVNHASSADKATQDGSGQTINTTYIKNINIVGQTVTITRGDDSTFVLTTQDTTYSYMEGATSSENGSSGLVPAPTAGKQDEFLRGDGNWGTPSYATSSGSATKATQDANGNQINTTYAPLNSPMFTGTPTAPTAASGDNGQTVANTEFVTNAILDAIGNITEFEISVVGSYSDLPETGASGTIYFVPTSSSTTDNSYDEYVWLGTKYEKLGSFNIDLSGYVNDIETSGTGNAITSVSQSGNKIVFSKGATFLTEHPSVTKSSSTATETPSAGGTIEVVDSVTTDEYGHLTSYRKKTVTLPDAVKSATKALQDNAGQQIDSTYIKSLTASGKTITYTKGDGTTGNFDTQDTTYSDMKGATSSENGSSGLVPAPVAGEQNKFFRGDGTWAVPSDRKYCLVGSNVANTAGWYKVASQTMSGYSDTNVTFMITSTYSKYYSGILQLQMRCNNTAPVLCSILNWHTRLGFEASDVICVVDGMTYTIYVNQTMSQYGRIMFEVISESSIAWASTEIELHNSSEPEAEAPEATVVATDGASVNFSNSTNQVNQVVLTSEDLNDIKSDNLTLYWAGGENTVVNNPFGDGKAFALHVYRTAAGYRVQEAISHNGIRKIRYYDASNWSSWRTLAYSDDFVPITGGKMTGDLETQNLIPETGSKYNLGSSLKPFLTEFIKTIGLRGNNNGNTYGGLNVATEGTSSVDGETKLVLGNNIPSGSEDNSAGLLRIFGKGSGFTDVYAGSNSSDNLTINLPEFSGTLALTNIFQGAGTNGTSGYIAFAQIKVTGTYVNRPMEFELSCRKMATPCYLSLQFANSTSNDPDINNLNYFGTNYGIFAHKVDTSTWLLYHPKTETYDNITVLRSQIPPQNIEVTYPGSFITEKPTENVVESTIGGEILRSELSTSSYGAADEADFDFGELE